MSIRHFLSRGMFAVLAVVLSTAASASLVGDTYTVSTANFPLSFGPSGPLTFNANGDLAPEMVSGSSDSLIVTEQMLGAGPNGGELLFFQFTFLAWPADYTNGFAFLISDLDWPTAASLDLQSAFISMDFGDSWINTTDVSALTSGFNVDGLHVLFETALSWQDFFGFSTPAEGASPTSFITSFVAEVKPIPVPPSLALLGLGLLGMSVMRRRR